MKAGERISLAAWHAEGIAWLAELFTRAAAYFARPCKYASTDEQIADIRHRVQHRL